MITDTDGYAVFTFTDTQFYGHFDKTGRLIVWDDKTSKMVPTDFVVTKSKINKSRAKEKKISDTGPTSKVKPEDSMVRWNQEANGELPYNKIVYEPSAIYHWYCDNNHHFKSSPTANFKKEPGRCGLCTNKTEAMVHEWLVDKYQDVVYQPTFEWCKTPAGRKYRPFDFYLPSLNTIVEVDGPQHFSSIGSWKCCRSVDVVKMRSATNNGTRVVRIPQEPVWLNKCNWMDNLAQDIASSQMVCMRSMDNFDYKKHMKMYLQSGSQ